MIFSEKLQILRKSNGFSQEELSERLNVSRQAIAKWESGQSYPDIANLIALSNLMNVTVDYLVRDQECAASVSQGPLTDAEEIIAFRLKANVNTYAAFMNETKASRKGSHDFSFSEGEFSYYDTYLGGERFAGEEAVWKNGRSVYAMNYMGRVLDQRFSGNFLKEALRAATAQMPFRGPEFYQSGEYIYKCRVTGDIFWFLGYEEIYCGQIKTYECNFHGGMLE